MSNPSFCSLYDSWYFLTFISIIHYLHHFPKLIPPLLKKKGHQPDHGKFPLIPGNDTVSKVYKKGSKVTKYDVGQRVIPLLLFDEGACQEYMVVKEDQILTSIPDEVDDFDASQFVVNGLTVYILFEQIIPLKEGDWAIQTAAASVIGRCAIQLAKVKGIKMINVVRKQEQIEELKSLGADHVIVYKEGNEEALKKEVFDITGGKGVKYAIDAVGGKMGTFAFDVLSKNGTHASYGLLSGQPLEIKTDLLIFKHASLVGFLLYNWFKDEPKEKIDKAVKGLVSLLKEKKVSLKYDEVYEFKDYKKAIEASKSKKVILVPKKK